MKKAAYVWDWYLKSVDERDIAVLDIINIAFGKVKNGVLDFDKPSVPAEIARMLGGEKLTSVTRKHAEELLENGKKKDS